MSESDATSVDLERYLAARLGPLAFFLLVVVAVSAPLVYMVMGVKTIRTRAQSAAKLVSELIHEEAQRRPVMWRYDAPKLLRHVGLQSTHPSIVRIELTDNDGRVIDLGRRAPLISDAELLWHSEPIYVDSEVARVWVGVTTEEVERQASLIFLGFAVLGVVLAGVMYGLPVKAIVVAQRRIDTSQRELERLNTNLEATAAARGAGRGPRQGAAPARSLGSRGRDAGGRAARVVARAA